MSVIVYAHCTASNLLGREGQRAEYEDLARAAGYQIIDRIKDHANGAPAYYCAQALVSGVRS